ncbi:hydrolase [Dictyobacter sp. S3.2.2.5]|uniref:Hydrolase n=1 Tax=Dictyobacter halimunensis TaxID=3026934 RepID=A0ABQ6FNM4_9CHLR|nr:hydrolase [Dictyobacter sp. S3.2.2.5]
MRENIDSNEQIRQQFLEKLGTPPQSCALNIQVLERYETDEYRRERIRYTASPGVDVPAYLFFPRKAPAQRLPAVLCIHQHSGEFHLGKSEPAGLAGNANLFYGLELCQRGYVTLMLDLEGFEERQSTAEDRQRWEQTNKNVLAEERYERFLAMHYLLTGSTLQARYVWDLSRAVDVLCTLPEVDANRIGTIGHSLGGQEVCWSLLFDRRLKAGVCSCGVGTFATILHHGINHNFAAYVPGLLSVGDVDALISSIAPTPLMMTAGTQDWIFPIDGVRRIGQQAAEAYAQQGVPDAFRLREFAGGHGFPTEVRAEAYQWLDRWLQHE